MANSKAASSRYLFPVAVIVMLIAAVSMAYILVASATPPTLGSGHGIPNSTSTINNTYNGTFNPANELSNISRFYPSAGPSLFSCSSDSDCELVHTQLCFNNLKSQQTCIAKSFNGTYASYYGAFLRRSNNTVCPMFLVSALASCECISGNCSMLYNAQ